MAVDELRQNDMMAHLMDSLDRGEDIGHYGRLVFTMVARHFMNEKELLGYLQKDPECPEEDARALYREVESRGYNPPKRERVLEWQEQQEFPICPDPGDPDACNVYKDLKFPDEVYQNISEYHEAKEKAES